MIKTFSKLARQHAEEYIEAESSRDRQQIRKSFYDFIVLMEHDTRQRRTYQNFFERQIENVYRERYDKRLEKKCLNTDKTKHTFK